MPTTNNSTQQVYRSRAAVRTAIQTALPIIGLIIVVFIAAGPEIATFIDSYWPGSPVDAWILREVAFAAGLAGLLARLAALPAVDRLLEHVLRLGSAHGVDTIADTGQRPRVGVPRLRLEIVFSDSDRWLRPSRARMRHAPSSLNRPVAGEGRHS